MIDLSGLFNRSIINRVRKREEILNRSEMILVGLLLEDTVVDLVKKRHALARLCTAAATLSASRSSTGRQRTNLSILRRLEELPRESIRSEREQSRSLVFGLLLDEIVKLRVRVVADVFLLADRERRLLLVGGFGGRI